jgi:hypothetical protein
MTEIEEIVGKTSNSSDKKPACYGCKSSEENSVSYLN